VADLENEINIKELLAYVQFVDGSNFKSAGACIGSSEFSVPHESAASLSNIGWFDCGDSRKIHDFQIEQLRISGATTLFACSTSHIAENLRHPVNPRARGLPLYWRCHGTSLHAILVLPYCCLDWSLFPNKSKRMDSGR